MGREEGDSGAEMIQLTEYAKIDAWEDGGAGASFEEFINKYPGFQPYCIQWALRGKEARVSYMCAHQCLHRHVYSRTQPAVGKHTFPFLPHSRKG